LFRKCGADDRQIKMTEESNNDLPPRSIQSDECKGKSGQQIAKENVARVLAYVEGLKRRGERMPLRRGQPNWTAIALACGFGRGVFYDNDDARGVIEQAVNDEKLRPESSDETRRLADSRTAHTQKKLEGSERHAQRLEGQLVIKNAENEALRQENKELRLENKELKEKLRQLSIFEGVMATSGRRYIP